MASECGGQLCRQANMWLLNNTPLQAGIGCMLIFLQRGFHSCEGCKNASPVAPHILSSIRVKDLQQGVTVELSEQTTLHKGEVIYGRFTVPHTEVPESAIVTATWSEEYSSTPVWIFLRQGCLPDGNSFDKSSVNYVNRRTSVVTVTPTVAGIYYLRVECLLPLSSLQISVLTGKLQIITKLQAAQEMEHLNEIDV